MSEELRSKLKAHQDSKLVLEFLSHISKLSTVDYDAQAKDFSCVEENLKLINKNTSVPNISISTEANARLFEDWMNSVLSQSEMQSPIYIRLLNFYAAGWIQIQSDNLKDSL